MTALVWVQTLVVVVGTAWLLALIGLICVGGWYARTHPTAGGNDHVFQHIAGALRILTFGLTREPDPQVTPSDPDLVADWRPPASQRTLRGR